MKEHLSATQRVRRFMPGCSQKLRGVLLRELAKLFFRQVSLRRQERAFGYAVNPISIPSRGDVHMAIFSWLTILGRRATKIADRFANSRVRLKRKE